MRFCVFCGSKSGSDPTYVAHARQLGAALADRHIGLVYGGAGIGLMGTIADAVLERGGEVVGVLPHGLAAKEIAHAGLTHLHLVDSMHERKAKMESLSDGFIAMPGGFGTFEEILEIVTWIQLGLHRKPAGLLNVAGYYDPLLRQIERGLSDGFIPPVLESALLADADPLRLVERMLAHELPPPPVKWLRRDQT